MALTGPPVGPRDLVRPPVGPRGLVGPFFSFDCVAFNVLVVF